MSRLYAAHVLVAVRDLTQRVLDEMPIGATARDFGERLILEINIELDRGHVAFIKRIARGPGNKDSD